MGLALCINANKSPHDYLLALAPLLPLLTNLSGADLDLTLKVLTHEEFSPKDIPWKSSAELHEFLDDNQTLKQLTRKGTAEALAFDATVEEYHEICLRVRDKRLAERATLAWPLGGLP